MKTADKHSIAKLLYDLVVEKEEKLKTLRFEMTNLEKELSSLNGLLDIFKQEHLKLKECTHTDYKGQSLYEKIGGRTYKCKECGITENL